MAFYVSSELLPKIYRAMRLCSPQAWHPWLLKPTSRRHLAFAAAIVVSLTTLYYMVLPRKSAAIIHYSPPATHDVTEDSTALWHGRADQVKAAFLHAYHGYEQYAFYHDELRPLSNMSVDK